MTPNLALALLLAGLLLIYCELIWLGSLLPGISGAVMAICGVYCLLQFRPSAAGLQLMAAATACFAIEARCQTFFMMGAIATGLLACGFWKLYSHQPSISAALAFPVSFVFGAATIFLLDTGKRARRNKQSDL